MTIEAPLCRHHEIIEPPDGPTSVGRCIYCGHEKEYQNHKWPDYNNEPLNEPQTTPVGRKLKRDWALEWKEPVWRG